MKLERINQWEAVANVQVALGDRATPEVISHYTGYAEHDISQLIKLPKYLAYLEAVEARRIALMAGMAEDMKAEMTALWRSMMYEVMVAHRDALRSKDESIRMQAVRTAHQFNPEGRLPVVQHEIVNRFTKDEIEQARDVIRKMKAPLDKPKPAPAGDIIN